MNDVPCPGCNYRRTWLTIGSVSICRNCMTVVDSYAYGILKIPKSTSDRLGTWFPLVFWFISLLIIIVDLLTPGP